MVTNHHPDLNASKHFLADHHQLPDLSFELEKLLLYRVEITPVPHIPIDGVSQKDAPHDVLTTTWKYPNQNGVLTEEVFYDMLSKGMQSLADQIIDGGHFKPYPMTHKPATVNGVAYHDYNGALSAPIDVRFIITYGQIEIEGGHVVYGLAFHIVTLIEKGSHSVAERAET